MEYKVSKSLIESKIVKVEYVVMPSGKTTVCEITLLNGFTTIGTSGVVDIKKFDLMLGRKYAYEKAFDKIWEVEGYLMQQRMYEDSFDGSIYEDDLVFGANLNQGLTD